MGLRSLEDGYVPPILDVSKLDRKVLVSNEESVAGLRALLDAEGIFAGVSSGAVVHVARRLAAELDEGVVVAVLADGGWKYLSADFWEAPDVERVDGAHRLVVIPADVRRALEEHARAEEPNEACGLLAAARRRRGALRRRAATAPRRRTASSSTSIPRSGSSRTRATSSPSSTRTSSSPPRPSRTDVENIGLWEGAPVRDPLAPHRRARRLADRGRTDRAAGARDGRSVAARRRQRRSAAAAEPPGYLTVKLPFIPDACGSHTNL